MEKVIVVFQSKNTVKSEKEYQIKYRNLFGKWMWKSMRVDKYLGCKSSLKAYLQIGNIALEDNLGLNLYIMLTTCYMVVILDGQKKMRRIYSNLNQILS